MRFVWLFLLPLRSVRRLNQRRRALSKSCADSNSVPHSSIDGSYTTGKPEPSDVDLALLATGTTEAETLRHAAATGVYLTVPDLFVLTTRASFERWVQCFSVDRVQQVRGVVILTIWPPLVYAP